MKKNKKNNKKIIIVFTIISVFIKLGATERTDGCK